MVPRRSALDASERQISMRVLFTPYPSFAHQLPIVPLAWAFQNAGHEVRVATHTSFVDAVVAAGLTPVPLGEPGTIEPRIRDDAPQPKNPDEVLHYADVLGLNAEEREHWITFYQYFLAPAGDYVRLDLPEADELITFAGNWRPDLILWDPLFTSAPVAARTCGAAHARILFGTDVFAWSLDRLTEHREQLRAAGLPENPLADVVRPLAQRYGVGVDTELLVGQWTIDPMPAGFGPPTSVETIRMRYVPYSGAETFQPWLHQRPDRPRVALSLGESTRRFISGDWDRLPRILDALADLDVEVIATLNDLQLQGIERIPDNVRTIEWIPLTHLMPTCSAIIHHGGVGTYAAACASRVPQLICDTEESVLLLQDTQSTESDTGTYQAGREFGVREETPTETIRWVLPAKSLIATPVSNYIINKGAGVRLNHRSLTTEEIGEQILRVVNDPTYRDGANNTYQTWLATPSPADIVTTFERLTRKAA